MGFWFFMLIMNALIPLTMIIFGYLYQHHPPKKVNYLYGYRTSRSMRNLDTWQYAHQHLGRNWLKYGSVTLRVTLVLMLLLINKDTQVIGLWGGLICGAQLITIIASIFPTEKALKEKYDLSQK